MRFGHKDHHNIWLEPEGYDSGMYEHVKSL